MSGQTTSTSGPGAGAANSIEAARLIEAARSQGVLDLLAFVNTSDKCEIVVQHIPKLSDDCLLKAGFVNQAKDGDKGRYLFKVEDVEGVLNILRQRHSLIPEANFALTQLIMILPAEWKEPKVQPQGVEAPSAIDSQAVPEAPFMTDIRVAPDVIEAEPSISISMIGILSSMQRLLKRVSGRFVESGQEAPIKLRMPIIEAIELFGMFDHEQARSLWRRKVKDMAGQYQTSPNADQYCAWTIYKKVVVSDDSKHNGAHFVDSFTMMKTLMLVLPKNHQMVIELMDMQERALCGQLGNCAVMRTMFPDIGLFMGEGEGVRRQCIALGEGAQPECTLKRKHDEDDSKMQFYTAEECAKQVKVLADECVWKPKLIEAIGDLSANVIRAEGDMESKRIGAAGDKEAEMIRAAGGKESKRIRAEGDKEAEMIRAEGYREMQVARAKHDVEKQKQEVMMPTISTETVDAVAAARQPEHAATAAGPLTSSSPAAPTVDAFV